MLFLFLKMTTSLSYKKNKSNQYRHNLIWTSISCFDSSFHLLPFNLKECSSSYIGLCFRNTPRLFSPLVLCTECSFSLFKKFFFFSSPALNRGSLLFIMLFPLLFQWLAPSCHCLHLIVTSSERPLPNHAVWNSPHNSLPHCFLSYNSFLFPA